jgi:hypothetical protein
MTIAALDEQIWGLEGFNGPPRQQRVTPYHPPTPLPTITGHPPLWQPSLTDGNIVRTSWPAFPCQSVWRSCRTRLRIAARGPSNGLAVHNFSLERNEGSWRPHAVSFIANHEGPLPGKELSKRFAAQPVETEVLRALHNA